MFTGERRDFFNRIQNTYLHFGNYSDGDKFVFILQDRDIHVATGMAKFIYHALKKGLMWSTLNSYILHENKDEVSGLVIHACK